MNGNHGIGDIGLKEWIEMTHLDYFDNSRVSKRHNSGVTVYLPSIRHDILLRTWFIVRRRKKQVVKLVNDSVFMREMWFLYRPKYRMSKA